MGEADSYAAGGQQERGPVQPSWDGQQQQQQQQQPYGAPPPYSVNPPKGNEQYGFDQAFKIPKPKYHDVWAGILVRRHQAVSADLD